MSDQTRSDAVTAAYADAHRAIMPRDAAHRMGGHSAGCRSLTINGGECTCPLDETTHSADAQETIAEKDAMGAIVYKMGRRSAAALQEDTLPPPAAGALDSFVTAARRLKAAELEFRAAQQAYAEAVKELSEEATK